MVKGQTILKGRFVQRKYPSPSSRLRSLSTQCPPPKRLASLSLSYRLRSHPSGDLAFSLYASSVRQWEAEERPGEGEPSLFGWDRFQAIFVPSAVLLIITMGNFKNRNGDWVVGSE